MVLVCVNITCCLRQSKRTAVGKNEAHRICKLGTFPGAEQAIKCILKTHRTPSLGGALLLPEVVQSSREPLLQINRAIRVVLHRMFNKQYAINIGRTASVPTYYKFCIIAPKLTPIP